MGAYKPGDHIQFHAARIIHGNPVTGKVISEDETWLEIELTKYIEGAANVWIAGEKRSFRKSFLSNIKVLDK